MSYHYPNQSQQPPQQYYQPPPGPPPGPSPGQLLQSNGPPQHSYGQQGYPASPMPPGPPGPPPQGQYGQAQYGQPPPHSPYPPGNTGYPSPVPQGAQGGFGYPPPQSNHPQQPGYSQQYQTPHSPQPLQHPPYHQQQQYPPQHPPQPPYAQQPQQPQHPHQYQQPQQFPPPQQGYGAPVAVDNSPASVGYGPGQIAHGDFRGQAEQLRKAMKGFGTDEKLLIQVLSKLGPLEVLAVRDSYDKHIKRNLVNDVKSETSSYFRQGLLAILEGPLMYDTALAREAVQGIGTKEWLLNDVLLGRKNNDLKAISDSYERVYGRKLQKDVESDLSFKTKTLFNNVLRMSRHDENQPIDPRTIEAEAQNIHGATAARVVNNADEVSSIFARSSNAELGALSRAFQDRYHTSLEAHIEKEFSGHMKDALLHIVRTAVDPALRDAILLEECMKGMGTKDERLVVRVVRLHWDRNHLQNVKGAYQRMYKQDLIKRVKGETSGDYQRLLVAMLE
ncbi:hypothetical protein BJY04DRAFT_186603 [Aspergillus karnatakaensis]|uniref:annexin n=1 Tax=Aspergillus karnatakaensis TaxID=1810916 RepID=UPI003CCDC21F